MTALGRIDDVSRTVFRDEMDNKTEYPLDTKLNLQLINGNRSHYTQVFSHNTASLYAELTEKSAVATLERLLGIKIEKATLSNISQSVASKYIMAEQTEGEKQTEEQTGSTSANDGADCNADEPRLGFISGRLNEIDVHPNRDSIIQDAINGKLIASAGSAVKQTVIYALADGTGVPGLKKELSSNGKGEGGAKTFEAKIGSVFQQGFDDDGLPILSNNNIFRLPGTTKYTGTVNKIDQFSPQFTRFAEENGVNGSAQQVVFLADGAAWLWKMQERLCPNAICIIDFYHASEHLDAMINKLSFQNPDERQLFGKECRHLLELGDIEKLETQIYCKVSSENKEYIGKCLAYFTENADKMRYGLFKATGLFIGSGVIEAACKTIVGKRMKNAGMHWSKKNAEGVIALRCAIYSGTFDSDNDFALAA